MTVDFTTREGIMKEWHKWVKYIAKGGGGSWPWDAFESLLDYFDETSRLKQITKIIEDVDNRCMAADGPVTPTLEEMSQDEILEIYSLARKVNNTKKGEQTMSEKITTRARVRVTMEIDLDDKWGSDYQLDQLFEQSKDQAMDMVRKITDGRSKVRIVGEPKVETIMVSE